MREGTETWQAVNSVSFTILGTCVSMKNRQILTRGRIVKSADYRKWAESFCLQVPPDARGLMLGGSESKKSSPTLLRAIVSIWYPNWRSDVDVECVWDLLQLMRVVSNDRWIREKVIYGAHVDPANPRIDITIEEI